MKKLIFIFLLPLFFQACGQNEKPAGSAGKFSVLVFSKTAGYRHESIPAGQQAIFTLGKQHGFEADTTEDASFFTEGKLKKYAAVIFLNTTLDVLDSSQQLAFEKYIQAGNGFVGIHAAADTEYDWPWYGKLVGAYFESHPPGVHEALVYVVDKKHPAGSGLPDEWVRTDEWYNFKNFDWKAVHTLCLLDGNTYEGGAKGKTPPIAWCHEYDGGRAFYTGMGHTPETFSEPYFIKHLWGGIKYAAGK